ncbi:MAG: TlpA disulfide reductase family protein [Bacteroidota bacterium]
MKSRFSLLFFFIYYSSILYGQSPMTILLENELTHLMDPPAKFIIFTFKYRSDTVYYNEQSYLIKPPKESNLSNSAFGFLQFAEHGWNNIPSQTIFYIDNYDSETPKFYIDENFDLDFNNEKVYDFPENSNIILELKHNHFTDTKVKVGLDHILFKDEEHKARTQSYANHKIPFAINNEFLSARFWLTETRYNYKLSVDSNYIGLKDFNNNGRFNDIDDQILIADSVGGKINDRNQVYRYNIGKDSVITFHGQDMGLVDIDSLGNFIILELLNEHSFTSKQILLKKGMSMPDFEFTLFNNEKTTWEKTGALNKFVLIDFWGTWCKPCLTQSQDLKKIKDKYSNKLEILGLAYQDNRDRAISYVNKNKLDWIHGFANKSLISQFQILNFPYYILVNPNGEIVSVNSYLTEIEQLIK